MSKLVSSNLIGTQQNSFRVGKKQFTLYTGDGDPNITPPNSLDNFHIGDKYFQKNIIGEWIWEGNDWKFIGGLIVANEVSVDHTAQINTLLPVDCRFSIIEISPPLLPIIGSRFAVVDSRYSCEEYYIKILTSSQNLYGESDDYIINTNGANVMFVYINSSIGWTVT
jgi:hypothetical protein